MLEGAFEPGAKLTNRYLAQTLGFSITPVREAIRRLVSEGALGEAPNGSVFVPALTISEFLREFAWLLMTLECRAATLAAPRLGDGDIVRLESLFNQAQAARQRGEKTRASARYRDFYTTVFRAADQPTLLALLDILWLRTASLQRSVIPLFDQQEDGRHYLDMLDAARKRDPQAAISAIAGLHERLGAYLKTHASPADDHTRSATVSLDRTS